MIGPCANDDCHCIGIRFSHDLNFVEIVRNVQTSKNGQSAMPELQNPLSIKAMFDLIIDISVCLDLVQ